LVLEAPEQRTGLPAREGQVGVIQFLIRSQVQAVVGEGRTELALPTETALPEVPAAGQRTAPLAVLEIRQAQPQTKARMAGHRPEMALLAVVVVRTLVPAQQLALAELVVTERAILLPERL
jgi:hypothetical protein